MMNLWSAYQLIYETDHRDYHATKMNANLADVLSNYFSCTEASRKLNVRLVVCFGYFASVLKLPVCRRVVAMLELGTDPSEITSHAVDAFAEIAGWLDQYKVNGFSTSAREPSAIDYVTLLQCSAMVNKSKRTLENWKAKDTAFPTPEVIGEDGTADEWLWTTIRPYLEVKASRKLPEVFPAHAVG